MFHSCCMFLCVVFMFLNDFGRDGREGKEGRRRLKKVEEGRRS